VTPAQKDAAKLIGRWADDAVSFVRECLQAEPDAWQEETLRALNTNMRVAMKACKGPGKSALLAWIILWFLATRPHPKIAATSISGDNLSDNLWTELAKWMRRSSFLSDTFTWTKTRVFAKDHPETWWASARTWPHSADAQQQADTLAGLHADYIIFVLDEVGSIPDGVMAAAEAGLSTGIEMRIVIAGNPTQLSGPLYRACTTERHLWHLVTITGDPDSPKRSPRISIQWAREQIEKYGRDNPWVLVNVFGEFPPASLNALLGINDVEAAMSRHYKLTDYNFAAKIIGVDVARQGDDATVLFPRQGKVAMNAVLMRNADSFGISGRLAQAEDRWKPEATFVDASGGWGWGLIDAHRLLGRDPIPVEFAGKPLNPKFYNKRTEMWFEMAQWVKEGGALPKIPELIAELITPTYTFKGDRMLLEPKEQIKERLGRSPDYADALALTFASPVEPRQQVLHPAFATSPVVSDYDPLA